MLQQGQLSAIYQMVVTRDAHLDDVEVLVELQPAHAAADGTTIAHWLQQRIKTMVGISTRVNVLPPHSVERTQTGKARRVVDKRPRL